jgi:hypothetical protein
MISSGRLLLPVSTVSSGYLGFCANPFLERLKQDKKGWDNKHPENGSDQHPANRSGPDRPVPFRTGPARYHQRHDSKDERE